MAQGMRHFTVVVGDLTPQLARIVLALMNFMFRAHASTLTETDLAEMEADLATFHREKDGLIAKGVYESGARFDGIPKLHMLRHYTHSIRRLGTPDGYNTEGPEHLHIEYCKIPWRASNKVKPMDRHLGLDLGEDADVDGGEIGVEMVEVEGEGEVEGEVEVEGEGEGDGDGDGDERAAAGAGDDSVQPGGGIGEIGRAHV